MTLTAKALQKLGFEAEGVDGVVIDLRQNPGGDNSFSDPMVAWFATEPFRFASSFHVRSSVEAHASNQARIDNSYEAYFDPSDPTFEAYQQYRDDFGSDEFRAGLRTLLEALDADMESPSG